MDTKEYNGWSNWETWNVLVWLDNEENLYNIKQSFIRTNEHKQDFDNMVKSFLMDLFPNGTQDMDSAEEMKEVNYQEIAETWKEEYKFENKL
jgi:hypothetical protein